MPPPVRGQTQAPAEERVEVRRYLGALRRSRWLIFGTVALITGAVVIASLALPKSYLAETSIVLDVQDALGQTDPESTRRQLATVQTLLTSPRVLESAAGELEGEDPDMLGSQVSSQADPEANIITVSATDDTPEGAARIANTVSQTFLAERTRFERERLAGSREQLEEEITNLENAASPSAQVQIPALRDRISQLSVSEGSAGSDLQLVSEAEAPSAANSSRPLRNGLLALFGSLFLAVLLALGRDQFSPRINGPRELGRALELRVLTGVPYVRGLRRRRAAVMSGVEAEAYETLRASVELALRDDPAPRLLLMTGGVHGEGKTTATWRLASALARSGQRALLVSADLRVPRLHELAGLPIGLGLSDILAMIDWEGGEPDREILDRAIIEVTSGGPGKRKRGRLDMITSGTKAKDPGRLLTAGAMAAFLKYIRQLDYDYVMIDAPPLLGIVDAQVLARHVDHVILVNRLDRLTVDNVADLRQTLDRMEVAPLGVVVIGARAEVSPYYMTRRPAIVQTGAEAN